MNDLKRFEKMPSKGETGFGASTFITATVSCCTLKLLAVSKTSRECLRY